MDPRDEQTSPGDPRFDELEGLRQKVLSHQHLVRRIVRPQSSTRSLTNICNQDVPAEDLIEAAGAPCRCAVSGGALEWQPRFLSDAGREEEALLWLRQAAQAGDMNACQRLTNLLSKINRTDEADMVARFGLDSDGATAHPWEPM